MRGTDTVTFLMTDIEGSTRLWETAPDAMRQGLQRHDEVLRAVVKASGGVVAKQTGDGVMAVFEKASGAVHAAVAAERELLGAGLPFRVRVGAWFACRFPPRFNR